MTRPDHANASSNWARIVPKLENERFRNAYFEKTLKAFLANQIRIIRGDESQTAFGKRLGMTQSVVSRLEDEGYGKLNAQTLIDLAQKLGVALIIKFVDYPTFLQETDNLSEAELRPKPFDIADLNDLAQRSRERAQPRIETDNALRAFFEGQEARRENHQPQAERTLPIPPQPPIQKGAQ